MGTPGLVLGSVKVAGAAWEGEGWSLSPLRLPLQNKVHPDSTPRSPHRVQAWQGS